MPGMVVRGRGGGGRDRENRGAARTGTPTGPYAHPTEQGALIQPANTARYAFDRDMKALPIIFLTLLPALLPVNAATSPNSVSVASAARAQIGKTVGYDPAYRALDYPNGDVPI